MTTFYSENHLDSPLTPQKEISLVKEEISTGGKGNFARIASLVKNPKQKTIQRSIPFFFVFEGQFTQNRIL